MIESNFIVPKNVQALIWREVVPELLVDASTPTLVECEQE